MNEFEIIRTFFQKNALHRPDVTLGIGDDCALVEVPPSYHLAITTDTLISGVHFLKDTSASDIGFKSLAVNLSDLAAMGATPAWFTLALTLPSPDSVWLEEFSKGLFELASQFNIALIGGDLTRAEQLSITMSAYGFVEKKLALKRSTAQPGDRIYVSHTLGDAALGLKILKNNLPVTTENKRYLLQKLNRPEPRVKLGEQLLGLAHAAIDISDGLIADLSHILEMSAVGAIVNVDELPLSNALLHTVSPENAIELALSGGDDYELCFTVPEEHGFSVPDHCKQIGVITSERGLNLMQHGQPYEKTLKGYQHFS